jgi:hypothetical protein
MFDPTFLDGQGKDWKLDDYELDAQSLLDYAN